MEDHYFYRANQQDTWQGTTHRENSLNRWAADLQNDFRARLDWCVADFQDANHPPEPRIKGSLRRTVAPGARVSLDAGDSTDPDGHELRYEWMYYPEAGSYLGPLPALRSSGTALASLIAPKVDAAHTIHLILTVTDRGSPPLTRYARVIVTVQPQEEQRP